MFALLAALAAYGAVRLNRNPTAYVDGVRLRIMQPNLQQDDKRRAALIIHAILCANALLGLYEYLSGWRLTPYVAGTLLIEVDWRSTALLGHPLANASVTGSYALILGIGGGPVRVTSHMTKKAENANNYDFIKGWTGADALSVLANSSDNAVRIPGLMKPHSVGVHPSPKLRVCIGWNSPVAATVRVEATSVRAEADAKANAASAFKALCCPRMRKASAGIKRCRVNGSSVARPRLPCGSSEGMARTSHVMPCSRDKPQSPGWVGRSGP